MTEISPEIIDINSVGNAPVITLNKSDEAKPPTPSPEIKEKPSVNFGGGLEFLMNDKKKNDGSKKPSTDVKLDDLNDLENELNDLSNEIDQKKPETKTSIFNKLLGGGSSNKDNIKIDSSLDKPLTVEEPSLLNINDSTPIIKVNDGNPGDTSNNPSVIGKITANEAKVENKNKTWDGFGKFNNIPVDPDQERPAEPKLSPEELLREKFSILRKLEALEAKGAKLTKRYNMESSLSEMKGEYEMILADKAKSNSCKFQGRMLMAAVTGLEFLNNRFDPFDIKLDGWSEQINENIDDYDEIFGELHEKYKSKATMAPELKLLFQLGGSAVMVHMTNTMFKTAMPGMDDIMRQNPELMQQFTQAAVNTMGDSNPGFGGFMNSVMGNQRDMPPPNISHGPPPMPMKTQQNKSQRHAPPTNRPDMTAARGDDGISIYDQYENVGPKPTERSNQDSRPKRPEMNGPSDISDILSGLKTKNINIQNKSEKDSKVSIQEISEMKVQKSAGKPKKRPKSERNTVSLEL